MQGLEPYWGRRALEFVDAIEASDSSACVISQFERIIGDLGFHGYIMAGIPTAGQSMAQTTIANGWPAEWFDETKSALHLMGVFAHGRLRALSRPAPATSARRLSAPEAEVLRWAARGKTAWETGQILGLSERNVRWHLEEAQRKLMTKNKTATVAIALVKREISL